MLKEIKGTILKDARTEGESALAKAEEELEAELAKVKAEGEAGIASAEAEAKSLVEGERRERLSWAKLESKRILAEAKEDAVKAAIDSLIERLQSYSGTRQYGERMKPLIAGAVKEVGGKAVIHVRKGDKKLLSVQGADIKEDADIIGGAIVESKDGKLKIDLSVEALLEARRDAVRKDIYGIMFK